MLLVLMVLMVLPFQNTKSSFLMNCHSITSQEYRLLELEKSIQRKVTLLEPVPSVSAVLMNAPPDTRV